ncbi:MAG TPA: glycoside hydrolase family 2 TIM barrel-domain containing protein [Opitutaceae bacterium]|nr:glycoside hydrolase family 2 TIM barrel-domain containing protein [Opitutaceae bacterium]
MKITLCAALLAGAFAGAVAPAAPITVSLHSPEPGRYELRRAGAPFYVRGAGGMARLDLLAAAGANSVRTWDPDQTARIIDEAGRRGLTVCAGLWVQHERSSFNYDDEVAVRAQIEQLCRAVDRFKDKPALLLWGVGNEVESGAHNPKVWDTIEAVAAYIKRVDPHHPVMTVIAHPNPGVGTMIRTRCPSVDLVGSNSYGPILKLAHDLAASGWSGPYLVTEWGTTGSWEVPRTPWGAEIEPTSGEKAELFAVRYGAITSAEHCLGSYAFLWGQKQEATPTWFGLFDETGRAEEATEVLAGLWSGKPAPALAPRVGALRLNGQPPSVGVRLVPGARVRAESDLLRGTPGELRVRWELLPESTQRGVGGSPEVRPESLRFPRQAKRPVDGRCVAEFTAPKRPGAYRLFVYVDGPGSTVAHANIPFLVAAP